MRSLATAAIVRATVATSRPLGRRRWRVAEREIAERISLGVDGIARGAHAIFEGGHQRAALLLHGYGDTPHSLAHLARRLHDAEWTVSAPLLPGHGRTLAAYHQVRAEELIAHAQQAFDALAARYSPVVVCGQSMGAALAIELATTRNFPALALLAPYISMPYAARALATTWPLSQVAFPVIKTRDRRSIQDPEAEAQSLGYGYTTPRLLSQLWRLVRRARRSLPSIQTATLIVHSREDNRVPPVEVQRASELIQHPIKSLQWLTGCGHVLTADYCKDTVASFVVEWFERCTAAQRGPAAGAR